jgi:hypothetical protein
MDVEHYATRDRNLIIPLVPLPDHCHITALSSELVTPPEELRAGGGPAQAPAVRRGVEAAGVAEVGPLVGVPDVRVPAGAEDAGPELAGSPARR